MKQNGTEWNFCVVSVSMQGLFFEHGKHAKREWEADFKAKQSFVINIPKWIELKQMVQNCWKHWRNDQMWAMNQLLSIVAAIKASDISDSSVVFLCGAISPYSRGSYWWHKSIKQIPFDSDNPRLLCLVNVREYTL